VTVPKGGARAVTVTGVSGVPRTAATVLVQVRVSARKAATVALTSTSATPASTARFTVPKGITSWTAVLSPSAAGTLTARTQKAAASVTVRVLAWASGASSVRGPGAPVVLARVAPKAVRTLAVSGTAGVPKASAGRTPVALLSVSAPAGSVVRLWSRRSSSTTPASATVAGTGRPVTVAVPTSSTGTVQVQVSGKKAATVHLLGWSTDTAGQKVTMAPRPGTRLLGPQDVRAVAPGSVTLVAAAKVGELLMINTGSRGVRYGRVSSAVGAAGGGTTVALSTAALPDGFSEYRVRYRGAVASATTAMRATAAPRPGGKGIGIGLGGSDAWSCSSGVPATSIIGLSIGIDSDVNLDLSLSDKVLDFSVKGRVTATATLKSGVSVSCSGQLELPVRVPIGATGLALSFGTSGSLTLSSEDDGTGQAATATAVGAMYAAIYIQGTDVTSDGTASGSGSAAFQKSVSGTLDLGVYASISPLASELIGIEPSGSLTLGMSLRFGPPQLFRGPRCVDLTLRPYAEIGVALAVDFFPDLSYSLPRLEGPPVDIYRGPCWGYEGTIGVAFRSTVTGQFSSSDDQRSYTVTMLPVPALYNGSSASQPFAWQGTKSTRDFSDNGALACTATATLSGSGSVTDALRAKLWVETDTEILFEVQSGTISGTWQSVCTPSGGSGPETVQDALSGYLCPWVGRPDPSIATNDLPSISVTRTRVSGSPDGSSTTTCSVSASLTRVELPGSARPEL
jgi:hypothetical protein